MKNVLIGIVFMTIISPIYGQQVREAILSNSPGQDRYGSYSPNGEHIVFESDRDGNWELYIMDATGQNQERLTTSDAQDRRPSWHPNGKKILFESNRNGHFELYELHVRTKKIKKLALPSLEGEPIFARYSPDGEKIAFSNKKSDQESEIVLIDYQGTSTIFLTDYKLRSFYPFWSPQGDALLFFSRHETNNEDDEIYKIRLDGSGKERLTHWPKHNFCPAWSPDGKKIAYVTSMEGTRPEIYIMDINGENKVRITYNEDGDTLPTWSGDSKKLLVTGYRNGNFEICELTLLD